MTEIFLVYNVSGFQVLKASQVIQWQQQLWTMQNLLMLSLGLKKLRTISSFQVKESMGRLMGMISTLGTKGLLLELGVQQVIRRFITLVTCVVSDPLECCFLTVPEIEVDTKGGKTVGYIYVGERLAGVFNLSDACRSGVIQAMKELKDLGIKTAMLTGDNQDAAMHAQEQVSRLKTRSLYN